MCKFIPTKIAGSLTREVGLIVDDFMKSQSDDMVAVTKLERTLFRIRGKNPADVCITIYRTDPDLLKRDPLTGGRVRQ